MFIDKLIEKIIELKSPIVVGLDPNIKMIPDVYKYEDETKKCFKTPGTIIYEFNKDVIDSICGYVPAVKPQMAYYEAYGVDGIEAFQKTVEYAKNKGLLVIEDAKRNDIDSSAQAYADGHIGRSILANQTDEKSYFDVDAITVNAYLGRDGVEPFVNVCDQYGKGIFVLVKTSNPSSDDFQDKVFENGLTLYETVGQYVSSISEARVGKYNYSSIGAVVGATYPVQSSKLRGIMKNSFFLVPGYGKQGGGAKDVLPCFDSKGLGAIINSSRGILYAYQDKYDAETVTREQLCEEVVNAVKEMREDIVDALHDRYSDVCY